MKPKMPKNMPHGKGGPPVPPMNAGKHDELLARCEIYREIYTQQTKGGEENE